MSLKEQFARMADELDAEIEAELAKLARYGDFAPVEAVNAMDAKLRADIHTRMSKLCEEIKSRLSDAAARDRVDQIFDAEMTRINEMVARGRAIYMPR